MTGAGRPLFGEQTRFMLLLITPAALLLTLFQVVPIAIGTNASFRDWALYNPKKTWVGLAHYEAVLSDPEFLWFVLPNTFIFMILSVAGALVLGLALALLLNRPFAGQKIVQTVLLVPLMVAPVIAAIMMRWMFNDQFGIVNAVLEGLGIEGQPWLVGRWTAFGVIVMTDIWLWTPWYTLLLLAGLQSLPREPFEAAAIDGTSTWRVFTHLTLPMLRSVIVVCVVIRAIDAFRTFDIAKVEVVEQLGSEILLETRVGEARVTVARVPPETQIAAGDQVRLSVQPGRLHFFDPDSEAAITA